MIKRFWRLVEHYLTRKIGVEIKCCLTFFMMLCFYSIYKLAIGSDSANIWHMLQMVLLAYVLDWIQLLLHADFDEVDSLGLKEWLVVLVGSAVYTAAAWLFCWFDGSVSVIIGFGAYMVAVYLCTFLIYAIKRGIDAKLLNEELKAFQAREE